MQVDTSILISSLAGEKINAEAFDRVIESEAIQICSLVLFEWLRGPRLPGELAIQEFLFPKELVIPFGVPEAELSAELYRTLPRGAKREIDLGIAACAILRGDTLWTLNPADFKDIPGLRLASITI
jgi:predicted nucleic acid-binding protein